MWQNTQAEIGWFVDALRYKRRVGLAVGGTYSTYIRA
jgi:hypothetical protein